MKRFHALSLGATLLVAALAQPATAAGPFGHGAVLLDADRAGIVDVRHRPGHVPPRTAKRRNNGAAVAGALIGAAIVGGAIIANSQPRRRYYDDGYYYGEPAYPQPYYHQPSQYYYGQPGYYPPPRRGRHYQEPHRYNNPAENRDGHFVSPPPGGYQPNYYRPSYRHSYEPRVHDRRRRYEGGSQAPQYHQPNSNSGPAGMHTGG